VTGDNDRTNQTNNKHVYKIIVSTMALSSGVIWSRHGSSKWKNKFNTKMNKFINQMPISTNIAP